MSISADGYLYVIKDSEGKRKLGFSKVPDKRVKDLQVGNALSLIVEYRLYVNHMIRAEKKLHDLFPAERLRGEWFNLTDDSKELLLLKKIFGAAHTTQREEALMKSLGLRVKK